MGKYSATYLSLRVRIGVVNGPQPAPGTYVEHPLGAVGLGAESEFAPEGEQPQVVLDLFVKRSVVRYTSGDRRRQTKTFDFPLVIRKDVLWWARPSAYAVIKALTDCGGWASKKSARLTPGAHSVVGPPIFLLVL